MIQYRRAIARLVAQGKEAQWVEKAVEGVSANLLSGARSFVVYGDPQSGKTEMMVALTCKLLDGGERVIVILVNDNIELLQQNLKRFREAGLNPAPKNFSEVPDDQAVVRSRPWVIFCKKNSSDLERLLAKISHVDRKIIIDDEADYASPNSKVNKKDGKSTINSLIYSLIGGSGVYIGVTATPARLNLNRTFENDVQKWVLFAPHSSYTGPDIFFPVNGNVPYILSFIDENNNERVSFRRALLSFMVNVALLNLGAESELNYSFLVHTSGLRDDHEVDHKEAERVFHVLLDHEDRDHGAYVDEVRGIAAGRYPSRKEEIVEYIKQNVGRNSVTLINSRADRRANQVAAVTSPATLFTVGVGGNIISRGVTFDNLLGMYFTRKVKTKFQQDTYIQRARMLGVRGRYLECFELTIPARLYANWRKCFIFHQLSLKTIQSGREAPVWMSDKDVAVTGAASINKDYVSVSSGEMSYSIFQITEAAKQLSEGDGSVVEKVESAYKLLGEDAFPAVVKDFILNYRPLDVSPDEAIAFHPTHDMSNRKADDVENIIRSQGFIGKSDRQIFKYPRAVHHLKIFYNNLGNARLFYKYSDAAMFLEGR